MRALSSISVLLVSCLLWSCEGSFGTNDAGGSTQTTTQDPNWYQVPNADIKFQGQFSGVLKTGERVVVAWESGFATGKPTFTFWGGSTIKTGASSDYYISFSDSLPSSIVLKDSLTGSATAVGHIFVTTDSRIHDSLIVDTANVLVAYNLLGTAVHDDHDPTGIKIITIFLRIKNPVTLGQKDKNNNPITWDDSNSLPGFSLLGQGVGGGIYAVQFPYNNVDLDDQFSAYKLWLWK
jgi:hypothetical protein